MLRIGLAGAGMVSRHHLIAWRAQSHRAQVVAIADPSDAAAATRAEEFGIPRRYPDTAAMLEAEGLDALDIASPRETHVAIVEAATGRGIPTLCQKPLAPSLAEAESLVARVAGRARLMVHENWRFRPYYRDMRAWIAEGRIGTPRQALATLLTAGMLPSLDGARPALTRQPFMRDLDRMLVAEVLIHHLDTLRFLLGPLVVEAATLGRTCPELRGEDRATIAMTGPDSLAAVLIGNMSVAGVAPTQTDDVTIIGDKGTMRLAGDLMTWNGEGQDERRYDLAACYQGSYDAVIAHFLDRLADGAPFETSPADNLETLRLVEDCYARATPS
ncbi:Gfo/Idh/MocA family protein [Roseomonas sp. KE2513]|uniref:Gfo/Idh/MocA family protein n=1 Tax=Roseomonas sp. KE2513 TaxID=2479202 RepID=UPI0018E027AA|nr:Gfo/Idh/MocA family oxidoreductase [Roseomonas sp. KE2513]